MRNSNRLFLTVIAATLAMALQLRTLPARAEGSSHIGNGAGIVEQNIFYAYDTLPKAISNCLEVPILFGLKSSDVAVLTRIRAIAQSNPASPQRIQFASEKASPGFFDTEVGQAYRLAKTGLTPHDVIYWNRDQFYKADGTPALDIPALSAIWVHELGHQAGLLDHAYLDKLGAAVRTSLINSYFELDYSAPRGQAMKLIALDYSGPRPGDIYLDDGSQSISLGNVISRSARCPDNDARLVGWSLTNIHWDAPLSAKSCESGHECAHLPVSAWIQLQCLKNQILSQSVSSLTMSLLFEREAQNYVYVGHSKLIFKSLPDADRPFSN